MKKGFVISVFLAFTLSFLAFAQAVDGPDHDPKAVIKRLSYENFRNIKLLTAAIFNYGGGDAEFDKLVQSYSEASSLYFSREYERSAKQFEENELEIRETAMNIAKIYKEDSEAMQKELIERDVRVRIKKSLRGKKNNETKEKMMSQSTAAILQANDYFVRTRPIQAIESYRISKDRMLTYMYIEADDLPEETVNECRKLRFDREKCLNDAKEKRRVEIRERYEKIISDNDSKVYISKEKAK
ncbi:MAG: hypothetical protein PF637_02245 [Spirochaetes bacterium]|jgi:ElaB/YqjD/DUF883 family membrane-anchored ribosome-binding protein|nr:hypothetical protein [Spirochaetota bacterium]